jgi:thiamine-phosphate pyrophosphorylase
VFLYYISDRKQLSDNHGRSLTLLVERAEMAAKAGVDAIQIRERDLSTRDLLDLSRQVVETVRRTNALDSSKPATRVLINSRVDLALSCGADGVHLRSDDLPASEARNIFVCAGVHSPIIGISCHRLNEIESAEGQGATFAVFGPIFEKAGSEALPIGVAALREVCTQRRAARPPMPVLALGGVNENNARQSLQAGAAGIAGIRLFQNGNLENTVRRLRSLRAAVPGG